METSNKPVTIKLPNGQEVLDILNHKSGGIAALVDFNVLKRLTRHLPQVNLEELQDEMVDKVRATRSLKDMVDVMSDEVAFHKTVNLIDVIDPTLLEPKKEEAVAAVGQPGLTA